MRRTADATEPVSAGERAGRSGANCLRRIGCMVVMVVVVVEVVV